jgi:hypothetical protein
MGEANLVNFGLYVTYFCLGLAIFAIVVFTVFQMIQSPKRAIKMLAALGIFITLFLICWAMGTAEPFTKGDVFLQANLVKVVEGMLYMVYIMLACAVASIATTFFKYIN